MKLSFATTSLLLYSSDAFLVHSGANFPRSTELAASSRRDVLTTLVGGAPFVPTIATAAEIDYDKITDLLGQDEQPKEYVPGGKRPTYLTEPTQEFKENEEKASNFKRVEIERKKRFSEALTRFTDAPNDEAALEQALDDMRVMVKEFGGMPLGITKEALVKQVRARKRKQFWPTRVERAYQDLINEIMTQQSPNAGRDMAGFL